MVRRNLVVVGGSAGAVEAVAYLLGELPADFSGYTLVVLHLAATSNADWLGSAFADRVLANRGPRENLRRPAIDVLFRSAAVAYALAVLLGADLPPRRRVHGVHRRRARCPAEKGAGKKAVNHATQK